MHRADTNNVSRSFADTSIEQTPASALKRSWCPIIGSKASIKSVRMQHMPSQSGIPPLATNQTFYPRDVFDWDSASSGASTTISFTAEANSPSSVMNASAWSFVSAIYSASNVSGHFS
jgi:hypothetical protein